MSKQKSQAEDAGEDKTGEAGAVASRRPKQGSDKRR